MCNNSAIILHSLWVVKWFSTFNEKERKTFQSAAQRVVQTRPKEKHTKNATEGSIIIASKYYQKIWNKKALKKKEGLIHFPVQEGILKEK